MELGVDQMVDVVVSGGLAQTKSGRGSRTERYLTA